MSIISTTGARIAQLTMCSMRVVTSASHGKVEARQIVAKSVLGGLHHVYKLVVVAAPLAPGRGGGRARPLGMLVRDNSAPTRYSIKPCGSRHSVTSVKSAF